MRCKMNNKSLKKYMLKKHDNKNYLIYYFHIFFFIIIKHMVLKNITFSSLMIQYLNLQNLIFTTITLKKKFLIFDDLTLKSNSMIYNFYFFKDIFFLLNYIYFVYTKNKSKKLFILYLSKLILLKNIQFFIFLNENFLLNELTLFNKFKVPKIAFVTIKRKITSIDYMIYISANYFTSQYLFFYYLYNLIKFVNVTIQKKLYNHYLTKLN